MTFRASRNALLLIAAATAMAGCGKNGGEYPSLSIRPVERATGSFAPVVPEPFVPTPLEAESLQRIEDLHAAANATHARFTAAANNARSQVNAARGAAVGSDRWSVAQIALANLESIRSEGMIPLAELDRIYVTAQTEGQELAQVEAARADVNTKLESEDRIISELLGQIAG